MPYYVYILANKRNGTLYTGVTNNLEKRVYEHKLKQLDGFTKRYGISLLVHFEETDDVHAALAREKQIKSWNRKRKLALIEAANPNWEDMSLQWNA